MLFKALILKLSYMKTALLLVIWLNMMNSKCESNAELVYDHSCFYQPAAEPEIYPPDYCENAQVDEEFDFIVVGGGPAGITVARRLAEKPEFKILLIEAGNDPPEDADVNLANMDKSMLWVTESEPSFFCLGSPKRRCTYRTAKILGGMSTHSTMTYARSNAEDFDELARDGNPGWSYATMLRYYRKLESYEPKTPFVSYHSRDGPLVINEFPQEQHPMLFKQRFLAAALQEGIPCSIDLNGRSQIGIGLNPGVVEVTGNKGNFVKAYLQGSPDNLKVCKNSLVTKLQLVSERRSKEIAVSSIFTVRSDKGRKRVFHFQAKNEYILAAGALGTPQILQRSGIGPRDILKNAKVPLAHELPGVGENLHERFINYGSAHVVDIDPTIPKNPFLKGIRDIMGFINLTDFSHPVPDIQILGYAPIDKFDHDIMKQLHGFQKGWLVIIGTSFLRQAQPGWVHINQTNPNLQPKLHLNQFTYESESDQLVAAVRLVRRIMKKPILAKYNPRPFILNQCRSHVFDSWNEIMCHARFLVMPMYNLAGTAKIGPKTDAKAVVDSSLKVHGVRNLRIVDLSVLPKNPRGGMLIPTIAVAEKAADIIKRDWRKRRRRKRMTQCKR